MIVRMIAVAVIVFVLGGCGKGFPYPEELPENFKEVMTEKGYCNDPGSALAVEKFAGPWWVVMLVKNEHGEIMIRYEATDAAFPKVFVLTNRGWEGAWSKKELLAEWQKNYSIIVEQANFIRSCFFKLREEKGATVL